jgi:hypothetical protein
MSIDALLPRIEAARERGVLVILKWDGERRTNRCTVVLIHEQGDWLFRRDTDEPVSALKEGLAEFFAR